MKIVIEKSFKIDKPVEEDINALKKFSVFFREINSEEIEIIAQNITLEEEEMEKVLDVFSEYGYIPITLRRYDSGRYDLVQI